jgi:hypothetical protein
LAAGSVSAAATINSSDQGDTIRLFDKTTGITAEINNHTLDQAGFNSLRVYYNNYALTEGDLFSRFIELKKSYISALQSFYNTNYLSSSDGKNAETAMQIYYEGTEALYGLNNCSVYLYNIVQYEGLNSTEQIHLDLIIPNRAENAVITIKFTIPKDKLDAALNGTVESMMSGFQFKGLPRQEKAPRVLFDKALMEKARLGVYPAASQSKPAYAYVENAAAGYSVSLPSTYVPYIQNGLGGVFTYTSYKINPNLIFSISSEPLQGAGMSDALTRFKVTSYGSVKILENSTKRFGLKDYSYLSYVSSTGGITLYCQDYYYQSSSRLYKLQLQSALAEPGANVTNQMAKILSGFYISGPETASITSAAVTAAVKFLNSEEGYSFQYPKSWRLEDVSTDIAYDRYRLSIPGLSGALDITVQESELNNIVTFADIVKSVNGKSVTSWPDLTVNYNPPFKGKISRQLYSDFSINGSVSTIYRLSAFMDENGRNRLCYSVDIIKNRKVYSLFITAAEYRTSGGQFADSLVNSLVNTVAGSFRTETTPESEARRLAGETRNRKLVFVEKYLKQLIDPRLTITSVDTLQADGTFYATVGNTGDGGFYKILLDYPNKQVSVVGSVLIRDILQSEMNRLKELYKDRRILSAVRNESSMTLTIESRDNIEANSVIRVFKVKAFLENGSVKWQTARLARQEDYMWECESYIKSRIGNDTKVYYSNKNVFLDIEPYKQKNMDYQLMIYEDSPKLKSFLVLSFNPNNSLFSVYNKFMLLDDVAGEIRKLYGITYLSQRSDAVEFNPETFTMTLHPADKRGNETSPEQYQIRYNPDKGILEYKKLY